MSNFRYDGGVFILFNEGGWCVFHRKWQHQEKLSGPYDTRHECYVRMHEMLRKNPLLVEV
jgi:hypothetical protein